MGALKKRAENGRTKKAQKNDKKWAPDGCTQKNANPKKMGAIKKITKPVSQRYDELTKIRLIKFKKNLC